MNPAPGVRRGNRVLAFLLPCVLVAAAGWTYALYDLLLSPSSIISTLGPQENHYWTVARFQIAALNTEQQVLLYERGTAPDFDAVTAKFNVLRSRYALMAHRSEAADMLAGLPSFQPAMERLGTALRQMEPLLLQLHTDRRSADELIPLFENMKVDSGQLAYEIGDLEVAHRDSVYGDFVRKRRNIFIASVGVAVLASMMGVLAVVYDRRRRAFVAQQSAALAAEQRANHAAAEAIGAKNAFLGAVGHELRTPLQSITSSIELLVASNPDEANARVMSRLDRAARQLESQMRDLTDYARLDSGKLALCPARFDAAEVLYSVCDDMLPLATGKGLELTVGADVEADEYMADAARLRQIIVNLISNAIKYTNKGTIDVAMTSRSKWDHSVLHIRVSDSGVGIPADRIDDVFNAFTQIRPEGAARQDGVGMGLTIVKGLVDLMGGEISVTSEFGRGTVFSASLPVAHVEHQAPTTPARMRPMSAAGKPRRAMVVDDQEFAREAIRDLLVALNYECAVASNGIEAMINLATIRQDVLLFDIQMPSMDGPELARKLRTTPGPNQHTPIVWISAMPRETITPSDAESFRHYLMKPVRVDRLRSTLEDVLRSSAVDLL
ncbi:signal transduction histidine kinase [Paraburkholderia sp. BL18I3N2]|uniref:ATP-binding response regulator n=1 Tax=Paraburkholderia sp. BL25I1N1 TaxID=1938804 RepID=UPI000D06CD26|nr:hybrid sensor histidine kinase/response regulator [Paraburkholderia sp. BL25I1N1]PRX24000.1 signal transduction histidine kinase [Paraburkholderia sp. BL18I3N2]PRX95978.1 signal transduction histidine kinase [Paraburkholderia sp. BL25I1N1]TDY15703.1 signal transduction histidine kinase [Paraburkholderia sp. BL6665CI2N2]